MTNYYQGKFIPKHPEKYVGDPNSIVFRSGWELRAMKWFDETSSILNWASEEIVIPYLSPIDQRVHRYFPDFLIKYRTKTGEIKKALIEIKPMKQTQPPQLTKNKVNTERYLRETVEYIKNDAKWKSAREWCAKQGIEFIFLTEYELGIHKYPMTKQKV